MVEFFQIAVVAITVVQPPATTTGENEHSFDAFFIPEGKPFGGTFPFYRDEVWHIYNSVSACLFCGTVH